MKLSPPRRVRIALAMATGVALSFHPTLHAQYTQKNEVSERLKAEAAALWKVDIKLKPEDFEQTPPPEPPAAVAAAGEEFVEAWREYQRTLLLKVAKKGPTPSGRDKNILLNPGEYGAAMKALLHGEQSPQPEEISQFFYSDYSWCGTDSGVFADSNQQAVLLACLRNKRYGEAVRILVATQGKGEVKEAVLTALGFDVRKVMAGAWLAGKYGNLETLCQDGSIYASRLALRWAELHWDEAVARQKAEGRAYNPEQATVPTLQLLDLLREEAGTPETKQQISDFLSKNATRLFDHERWLQRARPDAAKWLISIARDALQSETNAARKLGEKVLHDVGEKDVRAELKPAPGYRLYVNGQLWPLDKRGGYSHLGLGVSYAGGGGLATGADQIGRDGVITVDRDHFISSKQIESAHFYSFPSGLGGKTNVTEPWIYAEIPLPPAFGQTTDIRIETVQLTIKPKLPRPAAEYEGKTMEVDLYFARDEKPPSEARVYETGASSPLVIERVQSGEYWYRVRAPGAAIGVWQKIRVAPKANLIQPKLERGSQVTIPFAWPKDLELTKLNPDIADIFRRQWWAGLPGYFTLEKDGKPYQTPPTPRPLERAPEDRLVFPGLPLGKYTLKLRSSDEVLALLPYKSESSRQYAGWKRTELSFAVTAKSPMEFQTDPLKIGIAN